MFLSAVQTSKDQYKLMVIQHTYSQQETLWSQLIWATALKSYPEGTSDSYSKTPQLQVQYCRFCNKITVLGCNYALQVSSAAQLHWSSCRCPLFLCYHFQQRSLTPFFFACSSEYEQHLLIPTALGNDDCSLELNWIYAEVWILTTALFICMSYLVFSFRPPGRKTIVDPGTKNF